MISFIDSFIKFLIVRSNCKHIHCDLKCNLVTYGFTGKYDFVGKFLDTSIDINGSIIKLPYPSFAIAQNYLAAYSVSSTIGIDKSIIIKQLENTPIYPGRGELIEKNNITFINDSYNSNFESCANGLKSIASMNGDRKILVLGDMHELGDKTESEHIKLGLLIGSMNIDAVFGFGEHIRFTLDVIQSKKIKKKYHNKKNELIKDLKKYYNSGDIVYVKGSRCMKMEEIIYEGEN